MVKLIGHNSLKDYTCELAYQGEKTISQMIDRVDIPADLKRIIIPIRDSVALTVDDEIRENDEIHLFMSLIGG